MAQDPLTEKLAKANGDVKKLCEFFAARKDWTLAAGSEQSARDITTAAIRIDEHLKVLIRACGAEPTGPFEPLVESQDAAAHDTARVDRFTTFLRDLDVWLTAQPDPSKDHDTIAALQEMEGFVSCIIDVTNSLIGNPDPPETTSPSPQADGATQAIGSDGTPHGTIDVDGETPQQLALDNTDEHPMVQDFQGMNELTDECKDLVDGYLAAWGLEYSYYYRKRLLERILRWINSAPEGHVLVIKMKTVEDPYEPYPSYVSRDVLAGTQPTEDP